MRCRFAISPCLVVDNYYTEEPYAALKDREPIAVIGHSMLVFDLDQLGHGENFNWP